MNNKETVGASRKGVDGYIKKELNKLLLIKKRSRMIWTILTILLGICNIVVLSISVYIVQRVLKDFPNPTFAQIGPNAFMCITTIVLFVLGFAVAINANLKQDYRYRKMRDIIQHEVIKYSSKQAPYSGENPKEDIRKFIKSEVKRTFKTKKHLRIKKVILMALIGDKDD